MPEIVRSPKKGLAQGRIWAAAALVAGIAAWLALSRMPDSSEWGPSGEDAAIRETEQSLHSLEPEENPQGAPGGPLAAVSAGAYARRDRSTQAQSLYQSGDGQASEETRSGSINSAEASVEVSRAPAPGGPIAASAAAPGTAGRGTAPAADGWGDKPVIRVGRSRPALERTEGFGSGGGTSAAQWTVVKKPFGTGGDPGLKLPPAPEKAPGREAAPAGPLGRSMTSLRQTRKLSTQALLRGDETASGLVRRAFDAGGGRTSLKQMALEGTAAAGLAAGGEVPINLKASDPGAATVKSFEPPAVGEAGKVEDGDDEYMQQQVLMMIMGVSVAGIFGPALSGVGLAIASSMGLNPPSQGALNRQSDRASQTVGG